MFYPIYIIWFLLPLALLGLAGWAFAKPMFGVSGRENGWDYLKQGIFAILGFGIAVLIDRVFFDSLVESLESNPIGPFAQEGAMIVHWLLYPVVLLGMAYLNGLLRPKKSKA